MLLPGAEQERAREASSGQRRKALRQSRVLDPVVWVTGS